MSTRCQVWVRGSSAITYRHSDGYPDGECGVLASLLPFLVAFKKHRGWDPEYMTAHIVAHFIAERKAWVATRLEEERRERPDGDTKYIEQSAYLGHGVEGFDGTFHGDVQYLYVVHEDEVEVRQVTGYKDAPTLADTKLLSCVRLNGKVYRRPPVCKVGCRRCGAADLAEKIAWDARRALCGACLDRAKEEGHVLFSGG